ncbi:Protein of unknown function [Dyella sp. OK004]|uniref:DUF2845 domain-containing protein n=1 Tax=Dyella sp. OK004 TaxID=1855292 RepID=UPI0008E75F9A|nr:DUF2845 domain-containing protein [Dyella sp. OK004]SFR92119.1 Protein of unknown function [Dyella sp. OK004]
MRKGWVMGLFVWAAMAHASDTLRVGSKVLSSGDSAARVVELLGKPLHKARGSKPASGKSARSKSKGQAARADTGGERWQYRRGGRTVMITLTDGKVSRIDDGG